MPQRILKWIDIKKKAIGSRNEDSSNREPYQTSVSVGLNWFAVKSDRKRVKPGSMLPLVGSKPAHLATMRIP